jgi:putative SOS response-associated peptidase YedK
MCARFTLSANAKQVATLFDLLKVPELPPRYNIAPSQQIPAVRLNDAGERELTFLKWGLVPSWSDDESIGYKMLNARAETVATKPSFREAFRRRRCLISADGFYEWLAEGKLKKPFHFHRPDRQPFAFAGLWERKDRNGDGPLETCTIITTSANKTAQPYHDRMPVIIPRELISQWLSPKSETKSLTELLVAVSDDFLTVNPVSTIVNSPKVDDPRCIEAAASNDLFGN